MLNEDTDMPYKVGDVVSYTSFQDRIRYVTVTKLVVNKGRPAFEGLLSNGETVWGYGYQVIGLLRH